jgi:hypothetical protein
VSRYGVRPERGDGYLESFLAEKAVEFLEYWRIVGGNPCFDFDGPGSLGIRDRSEHLRHRRY